MMQNLPLDQFINHHLFSEAYIQNLSAAALSPDIPAAAQQTIREWRDEYINLESEQDLTAYLAQCLSALGYSYQRVAGHFVLFADETHSQALGLLLPVAGDDVGRMTKGRHYQAKLISLLKAQGLAWGIIANGNAWRLCHAKNTAPYEVYLQAQLDTLLAPHQLAGFSQFYRFFQRDGFQTLDTLLAASDAATQSIERHLKNRVDDILQALCLGFVDNEKSHQLSRRELDNIYHNAIVLLYRTLFLFYAEARNLLPVDQAAYHQYSLEAIVEDARRWKLDGYHLPDAYALWTRLATLCGIVDLGDHDAGVNAYNGGLFSDAEHPYLRQSRIRDVYLAPAIYHLAFIEGKQGIERITYRDLSVRHLGTLYEGMLEYRLNLVSDEPVVVREAKGKRTYIPQRIAQPKKGETILPVGQVYFADDKGERKSSGSYYTPEDVVQYIVSNTLGVKLEALAAPLKTLIAQAHYDRQIAASPSERAAIEGYADRQVLELVENVLLRLKILDPAMGSAHFLVSAAQMMTDFIVDLLNQPDWPNDTISTAPLLWKRRIVERCLYGVDVNPLAQELAKLSLWLSSAAAGKPLTFLDHHLKVGNSLYGAPLARLSRLPTAKDTAQNEGATTQDMFHQLAQRTLQSMLAEMGRINASDSERIEDVKSKNEVYQNVQTLSFSLRDLANAWLSTLFPVSATVAPPSDLPLFSQKANNEAETITEGLYFEWLQAAAREQTSEEWKSYAAGQPLLLMARRLAELEHFFHWELEFPDTVIDQQCQFDVVIANPPYVGTSPNFIITQLYETAKCGDLYAWIFERALTATSKTGSVGTILPLSIMFAGNKSKLRQLILRQSADTNIISCDNNPDAIFEAPGSARNRQRTTILLVKRTEQQTARLFTTDYLRWLRSERHLLFGNIRFAETTQLANEIYFPSLGQKILVDFFERLLACPKRIGDYVTKQNQDHFLCVQSAACYFVSAVPLDLGRRNQEILWFESIETRNKVFAILNSNVFYWYWRSRSDGFWVSRDQILSMPIPDLEKHDDLLDLANALWEHSENVAVRQNFNGKMVTTYYFNRNMETLLNIDDWIAKHVAPEIALTRDIFVQYKSNSFLRPWTSTGLLQEIGPEGNQ